MLVEAFIRLSQPHSEGRLLYLTVQEKKALEKSGKKIPYDYCVYDKDLTLWAVVFNVKPFLSEVLSIGRTIEQNI